MSRLFTMNPMASKSLSPNAGMLFDFQTPRKFIKNNSARSLPQPHLKEQKHSTSPYLFEEIRTIPKETIRDGLSLRTKGLPILQPLGSRLRGPLNYSSFL